MDNYIPSFRPVTSICPSSDKESLDEIIRRALKMARLRPTRFTHQNVDCCITCRDTHESALEKWRKAYDDRQLIEAVMDDSAIE